MLLSNAMSGNIGNIIQAVISGKFANSPLMKQYQTMMQGKSQSEQIQTLLNSAKSMGIDIDEKCFTKSQLANLGIKIP